MIPPTHVISSSCMTRSASASETEAALCAPRHSRRSISPTVWLERIEQHKKTRTRTHSQFGSYTPPILKPRWSSKSFATQTPKTALIVFPKMTFIWSSSRDGQSSGLSSRVFVASHRTALTG